MPAENVRAEHGGDILVIDKPYALNNKRKINVYLQAGNVSPNYSFML